MKPEQASAARLGGMSSGPGQQPAASSAERTTLELYTQLNFKLSKPEVEFSMLSRPLTVRGVSQIQRYFQNIRTLDELDHNDGNALATTLLASMIAYNNVPGTRRSRKLLAKMALQNLMDKSVAMKEVNAKYVWFSKMLLKVLEFSARLPKKVTAKLEDLCEKDAEKIGISVCSIVAGNSSAAAAVDEWMKTYPAMAEFQLEQPWFREFMNVVAKQQLMQSDWGLAVRVYVGALLSSADLLSDILVIWGFFDEGRSGFAWAMTSMVLMCLFCQLLIVYVNNKTNRAVLAREVAFTVLCVKPAADAWKLARGKEKEAHQQIDPLSEFAAGKVIELVAESIPGCILQMYSVVASSTTTLDYRILLSIAMSVSSTAFTSTALAYDLDTDPGKREEWPAFYGYVPDSGRLTVLLVMMFMAATQLAARALCFALLLAMGNGYALKFYLVDMGLFLAIKVARDDLLYWLPVEGTAWKIVMSLLPRVLLKTVADFTGFMQSRHPFDVGGAGWTANMVVGLVSVFVIVYVYTAQKSENDIGGGGVSAEMIRATTGTLVISNVLAFCVFLATIAPGYGWTFFDTRTAKQTAKDKFLMGTDPQQKLGFVWETPEYTEAYRADAKMWVLENYEVWDATKPLWWTPDVIRRLPDDFVPADKLAALKRGGMAGKGAYRGSIFESVFGEMEEERDEE
jgi:hypothetical protein